MKKTLMVLALGLASSTAFADERGQILFKGNINGGTTCPIEIVIPGGPGPIGAVDLENYSVKYFAANATTPDIAFALRVDADDATCRIPPGYNAKVTFDSLNGDAGASGEYYAIRDSRRGLAVALKDDAYAPIPPRTASKDYPVASTGVTDLRFYGSYVRTGAAGSVTEGSANADVNFSITLP